MYPQENKNQAQRYRPYRQERRGSFGTDSLDYNRVADPEYSFKACPWRNASLITTDQGTQFWAAQWAAEKQKIESGGQCSTQHFPPSALYSRLKDERTIRLLEIVKYVPASAELYCTIKHHALDEAPSFDALSYTWGSPLYGASELDERIHRPNMWFRQINCDGRLCIITENLFLALCQLATSKTSNYIWVDALCIDQTDLKEKESQILLMGDIYARANKVIIWLGDASSDVNNFVQTHKTLVDTLQKYEAKHGPNSTSEQSPLDPEFLRKLGIQYPSQWRENWAAYFLFFQRRRWFRRAWVIQEVALARDLAFYCGEKLLPVKDIYELGLMIRENGWRHALAEFVGSNPRGGIGDEADRLLEYRDQVYCGGPQDPYLQLLFSRQNGAASPKQFWFSYLQYMIQEIRRFQATDERDHIYAVFGLAKRFMPPNMTDPLRPDYSLTCEELYTFVTRLFIRELPILSSLSYVGAKRLELPSWVPDYSLALGRKPLIHLGRYDVFDASCTKSTAREEPQFADLGRELVLRGTKIDEVVEVCPTMNALRETCMVVPYLNICFNLTEICQSTKQDRVEVLWRTLIADTSTTPQNTHPAPAEYGGHFHDWILMQITAYLSQSKMRYSQKNVFFAKLRRLKESTLDDSPLPSEEEVLDNISLDLRAVLENDTSYLKCIDPLDMPCRHILRSFHIFDRAVKETRANRRVFRTRDGHLGLGPSFTDLGHEVWVLQGAKVPFVLEKGSNSYCVIGEAYLHGFMHGEMLLNNNMKEKIGPVIIS
jgi:hypothetical protein